MATLNRETIEQEIGKRFEKIEKTLERTLEKTLEKALVKAQEFAQTPAGQRATAAAERASEKITTVRATAQKTVQKSLDDVLLGLEHKGIDVKQSKDLIQTVGRRVLERASEIAEDVRTQVAAKPYSPDWLRNVADVAASSAKRAATAVVPVKDETLAAVETAATEVAGEPITDIEAQTATEADAALSTEAPATTAAAAQPDVQATSLAEASKSDQAADFEPAVKASSKKSTKIAKTKK